MPLELVTLRCLQDNYAYLLHGTAGTVLIDAPEARPVLEALAERGWGLNAILLTHHHADHIDGVAQLVAETGAKVIGAGADAHRLPPLDQRVTAGDAFEVLGGEPVDVIEVSGHTIGHVAYHFPRSGVAFTGDSLMAMGCGRLFEGSPAMMWESLSRLNALPETTLICSGHDYCAGNGAFALSVDPDNAALQQRLRETVAGRSCAPVTLAEEQATNPFLRVRNLAAGLGMADSPDAEIFARLRKMKDSF